LKVAIRQTQNAILLRPAQREGKGYTPPGGRMNVRGSATQVQGKTTKDPRQPLYRSRGRMLETKALARITKSLGNRITMPTREMQIIEPNQLGLAVKQLDKNPFAFSSGSTLNIINSTL
jgi:hypothetical protein